MTNDANATDPQVVNEGWADVPPGTKFEGTGTFTTPAAMTDPQPMETWRKERMYGERDTVLWAIVRGNLTDPHAVVGSALKEADADRIIADHELAEKCRREHGS